MVPALLSAVALGTLLSGCASDANANLKGAGKHRPAGHPGDAGGGIPAA